MVVYRWAGWLLGQSFADRRSVCIQLAELLFEKLLNAPGYPTTLHLTSNHCSHSTTS